MELKCCFADCTSVRVSTFNRTAYGIEMKYNDYLGVLSSGLLIAPLMELKFICYRSKR